MDPLEQLAEALRRRLIARARDGGARENGASLADLVENGTLPRGLAGFLADCVRARAAVLISGGTGSGKTTTLGALSGAIPDGERIVTIEDAPELRLRPRHVGGVG